MTSEPSRLEGTTEFAPERWEIAIEDAAELVAVLLDRSQAAFDGLGRLWRERPILMAALLAAGTGAVIGTFVAGGLRRPRPPASAVAQATAVAQAAAQRLAQQRQLPGLGIAGRNGSSVADRGRRIVGASRGARYALQLVPVVVTVLKNPLVRALVWRYAVRSLRR